MVGKGWNDKVQGDTCDSYALLRKMLEVGNGLESNGKRVNMVDVLLLIPFNISFNRKYAGKPAGKLNLLVN